MPSKYQTVRIQIKPFVCSGLILIQMFSKVIACEISIFSLTVKAATLIFISGCDSAISSAKEGKSGFIYNLVKG